MTSTMSTSAVDESGSETTAGDPVDTIGVLREQIDALDAAITRLVAERGALSRRVQAARMSSGGTRVELGRERVILATYRDALGRDGGQLAESILQVCRGAR